MPRWGVPGPQQSQSAEVGIPQPWGCCSTGSSPCQRSSRWSSHCSSLPALPTALSSSFLVQNPHLHFHIQQRGMWGQFCLVSVLAGCPDSPWGGGKSQRHHPTAPEMWGCPSPNQRTPELPFLSLYKHLQHFSSPFLCPEQAAEPPAAGQGWPHRARESRALSSPHFHSAGPHREAAAALGPRSHPRCAAASFRNPWSIPSITRALRPHAVTVTEGWNRCHHHSRALLSSHLSAFEL